MVTFVGCKDNVIEPSHCPKDPRRWKMPVPSLVICCDIKIDKAATAACLLKAPCGLTVVITDLVLDK